MKFHYLSFIFCILSLHSVAQKQDPAWVAVTAVLHQQVYDWNHGDIRSFMNGYWKHDSLTFIGKKGVTKGWQRTLDNYLKSYPDSKTMGQLEFNVLHMETLSKEYVHVIGKWKLYRSVDIGNVEGFYTLLFRKIEGKWVIVSDHTS